MQRVMNITLYKVQKKQYKDEGYITGLPVFSEKAKEDLHNFFLSLSTRLDETIDLNQTKYSYFEFS